MKIRSGLLTLFHHPFKWKQLWLLTILFHFILDFAQAFLEDESPLVKDDTVYCYQCMTKPPSYSKINMTALVSLLSNATFQIPVDVPNCKDTDPPYRPNFRGAKIAYCPESLTCVKLRGIFMGEPYVLRNCWDYTWKTQRKFDPSGGRRDSCMGGDKLEFLRTSEPKEICFCDRDLCNLSPPALPHPLHPLHTLTLPLLLYLHYLLPYS